MIQIKRMTNQRKTLLEELRKLKSHPTADALYDIVRKRLPRISLGTVYRNLELLCEEGDVLKLTMGSHQSRYDGNPARHYHICCRMCNRVEDIKLEPLMAIEEKVGELSGYDITGHTLEFYGICPHCRKSNESCNQ